MITTSALIKETWKIIHESNGDYLVSNFGNIKNRRTDKILKPRPTQNGYLRVHLPVDNGRKDFYIHRLVADAFCEQPDGCNTINHLDNNPQNNHADNLEWTTQLLNVLYSSNQGRMRLNAVPVVGTKDGKEHHFLSVRQAEAKTGCDHSTIVKCCKGKKQFIHGYQWKYAEVG